MLPVKEISHFPLPSLSQTALYNPCTRRLPRCRARVGAEPYLIMSAHRAHHQPLYIIAAHGGAGYHQPASDSSLKGGLRAAISSALPAFSRATARSSITSSDGSSSEPSSSWSALDATTAVIAALEDHPDFNAGYGSNLTFDGQVECDASLMLSTSEERSLPSLPSSSPSSPS